MNPWDIVKSINQTKENLLVDEVSEKEYQPFMVNRALSYYPDTIMYANEMNGKWNLDKKIQYDFLMKSISKKKRYSKWVKKESTTDLSLIQEYYKYSKVKALQVLSLLTPEDIETIKSEMQKGGKL